MSPPATAPLLLAPTWERSTGPLPVPHRGGRHRAPTPGRRRLGRALAALALALAPRTPPTRTETTS